MANISVLMNDNFKVLEYLFENKLTESENNNGDVDYLFYMTQRDLAEKLNLSLPTINKIIGELAEANFMQADKHQRGVYSTNTEAIYIYFQLKQLLNRNIDN